MNDSWYRYVDEHLTRAFGGDMTMETRLGARIKVLVENPKQSGTASHDRFELYKKCKTVDTYIENTGGEEFRARNGRNYGSDDLKWDSEHGFIKFEIP